ncbi:hypothetical protein DVH24_009926 [Malus domestica]|uniref:Uncharacterized protein n=1 Tax=Malus domestica TaxID=3750 RepID=A0A498JWN7_MALDO|nr:hypothetical protein DVH24_009926 [Malus domestica]
MAEYHDRLQEVERYKAKLKENKQLVDEARMNKGLLTQALQLKDETMESLKRRNGENLRLKKLLEATKKQLEVATLEVSKKLALKKGNGWPSLIVMMMGAFFENTTKI